MKTVNDVLDDLYPLLTEKELIDCAQLFHKEIILSLSNQSSSLPAILNPIHKINPHPGKGVAVAVGGTNGYVSLFEIKSDGVIKFFDRKSIVLPQQTSKNELFHSIAKSIFTLIKKETTLPISIGFAYPLKPILHNGYIDGELLYMAKGRNIDGLVGHKVGQEFHKFLKEEYGIDTQVNVANDSICLLLGGEGAEIAGIVGTGLNFAYWESRSKIAPIKLTQLSAFVQNEIAINLESKNFNKFPHSKLLKKIDKKSDDPGYSLAEKETAGAYLFRIFNEGKDEIVGKNFPYLTSTDQLNEIVTKAFPFTSFVSKDELQKARLFSERIFNRSAQIVAIELVGTLLKLNKTKGIVPIIMEGGIFWKAHNYPSRVNACVNMILPEVIPSFARLFGSSRRGIAIIARSVLS